MKKRLLYIYSGLLLFIISCLGFVYFLNNHTKKNEIRDYKEILEEGILRVGIIQDTIYNEISSKINDQAYRFFRSYNLTDSLEIEIHLFLNKIDALNNLEQNNIDLIASNIPITIEYLDEFNFTIPLDTDRLVLVQRKSKNNPQYIGSTIALEDKTIDINDYPSYVSRMRNFHDESGVHININIHDSISGLKLVEMVSDSLIDYTLYDEKSAKEFVKQLKNLDISIPIGFSQERSWVLRKESTILLDSMNIWIDDFFNISNR